MQVYNWLKLTIVGCANFTRSTQVRMQNVFTEGVPQVPPSHCRLFFLNRNRRLRVVLQPAISSLRGSRWITVACIFSTWCYNSRGWTKRATPRAIYSRDICTPSSDKRGLAAPRSYCSFRKENGASPCHRVRHFCRLASKRSRAHSGDSNKDISKTIKILAVQTSRGLTTSWKIIRSWGSLGKLKQEFGRL